MNADKLKSAIFRILSTIAALAKWIEIAEAFGVLPWIRKVLLEIEFD